MPRVLIIGYGNPLRADDGVGWQAACSLARLRQDQFVETLALHQLTPEMAEPISRADLVIFIDAAHDGTPGSWKCERLVTATPAGNSLAHHFTPASLVAYARAIFQVNPIAFVISVAGASFAFQQQLTPRVEQALPQVVERVCRQIASQIGLAEFSILPGSGQSHPGKAG